MKKQLNLLVVAFLMILAGCGGNKKKVVRKTEKELTATNDIALAFNENENNDSKMSFFDEDVEAFVLEEDPADYSIPNATDQPTLAQSPDIQAPDFALEEPDENFDKSFQTVYFDFDSYSIKKDEQSKVFENAVKAEAAIENDEVICLKGKADKFKGTRLYNLALSDKRAHQVAKALEEQGIPKNRMKVFGVGYEEAKATGKTKEDHAKDRCVEMYTIAL